MATNTIFDWNEREISIYAVLDQVGIGWNKLVINLINDLFKLGWNGQLLQIKEKFGTLRFYINGINDSAIEKLINTRIEQAEMESAFTCEMCGDLGTLNYDGWIRCLCIQCCVDLGRQYNVVQI